MPTCRKGMGHNEYVLCNEYVMCRSANSTGGMCNEPASHADECCPLPLVAQSVSQIA
jgi:hypothetical protein